MSDFYEKAYSEHGRYFCRKCAEKEIITPACERYSMGVSAGMYCDTCWAQDGMDNDKEYDYLDAGEYYSENDY